ncbi:EAL domain-containing protein [Vulcanococcus limneticus]|uniref:EAL domain-containing protein n=1 Tax=Vulcanococcus limneticus TaxID=2170428 RepID=UPI00398C00AA
MIPAPHPEDGSGRPSPDQELPTGTPGAGADPAPVDDADPLALRGPWPGSGVNPPQRRAGDRPNPGHQPGRSSLDLLLSRSRFTQQLADLVGPEAEGHFAVLRCRFKEYERVSATLGGKAAEALIDEGARRLLNTIPRSASAARLSDSDLISVLPGLIEPPRISAFAQRLIDLCAVPYRFDEQRLPLNVAIGIVISRGNYEDLEAILSDASMAQRIAGRHNQSQYRFIDLETRNQARRSYELEADFREALQQGLLQPFFQPIAELRTGEPVGYEVLARWPRPDGSFVTPDRFLPIARETALTGELDLQIIEKALIAVAELAREVPWRSMLLSVNVSANLLEDSGLRERLLELIVESPLPPGWWLQVELIEEALQDTSSAFDTFLARLSELKVTIAIDDFGTGYSSLARLHSLPIDSFKIDKSFVDKIDDTEASSKKLLLTMGALASDLSLSSTVEGVETEAQRQWLLQSGFRTSQGYLFGRPLPLDEAIVELRRHNLRPPAIQAGLEDEDGGSPRLGLRQRLRRRLRWLLG